MNLKKCSKCGENKQFSSFYFRKKGPRKGQYYEKCKDCMKIRGREYYHKNHNRQLNLAINRTRKYLNAGLTFLAKEKNKPCVDCGKYFPPWVMDFDHKDKKLKFANVAWLRRFHDLAKVKKEIEKCEIVCANCHRNRTFKLSGNNYQKIINELESSGYRFHWK
jgi:hypothetical protein